MASSLSGLPDHEPQLLSSAMLASHAKKAADASAKAAAGETPSRRFVMDVVAAYRAVEADPANVQLDDARKVDLVFEKLTQRGKDVNP